MSDECEGFAFAGPTLEAIASRSVRARAKVRWLPPVRRGDVARLVDVEPPQLLVIVDGQFHNCLSVAHRELLRAVAAGWEVWGLASMGAIRAYELRDHGVRGFGEVYQQFFTHEDFRDDEVALLHESDAPWRALSEPLVHIRVAVDDLVRQGILSAAGAHRVVETLAGSWFGDRTLERLRTMILSEVPAAQSGAVHAWLAAFGRYRIKSSDLAKFINSRWATSQRCV